jgi:hypothetical protein
MPISTRVIVSGPPSGGGRTVSLTTVGAGLFCAAGWGVVSAGCAVAAAAIASRTPAVAASAQALRATRRVRWHLSLEVLGLAYHD